MYEISPTVKRNIVSKVRHVLGSKFHSLTVSIILSQSKYTILHVIILYIKITFIFLSFCIWYIHCTNKSWYFIYSYYIYQKMNKEMNVYFFLMIKMIFGCSVLLLFQVICFIIKVAKQDDKWDSIEKYSNVKCLKKITVCDQIVASMKNKRKNLNLT